MRHVDDFIDDATSDRYAASWFESFRRSAWDKLKEPDERKLFARYKGKPYLVTGCSRMGDVWLHSDLVYAGMSYERRVNVDDCSEWSAEPPKEKGSDVEKKKSVSVQPAWCLELPMQQQSVLLLAGRGPDGVEKHHPCKTIHIAYRACVFLAARYGRPLKFGERADSFMSLHIFANDEEWEDAVEKFFGAWDVLPAHYVKHLMHGVEILGYKHPEERFRLRWLKLYYRFCEEFHLTAETYPEMERRLGDWNQEFWGD